MLETFLEAKSGKKRFAELALEEVMRRAETRTGWKVLGMSGKLAKQLKKQGTEAVLGLADGVALTATPAGRRTFERSGFTPTGYRELFVAKDTTRVDAAQADGPQVEMICLYPGDETFSATVTERATIISMSEMTVRYKP
ncbi:hypothetical protein N0V88_000179 [Collariella sp. IMI 366227]|nr:hypothetical protein N0V88_000179 [Collariella sp. IMI 366227]